MSFHIRGRKLARIVLSNVLLVSSVACHQESVAPAPTITSIDPQFVTESDTVVLSGNYFSASLSDNKVTFNGMLGTVITASATALAVNVPAGSFARAGVPAAEVSVRVANQASLQNVLLKATDYPRISQLLPVGGVRVGDKLTIIGQGFLPNAASSEVLFPSAGQSALRVGVSSVSSSQLQVVVPAGAVSGAIWLITYYDVAKTKYISETIPLSVNP